MCANPSLAEPRDPDGLTESVEFASPTCYASIPAAGCPVDNVLQLKSFMTVSAYTTSSAGVTRAWLTTPAMCPAEGHWRTSIHFWWGDGSEDKVVVRHPCTRPRSETRCRSKRRAVVRKACRRRASGERAG
jgi:hypothetical protein